MKRYKVIFAASAQQEILQSYEWGCRKWGKPQARRWARELRKATEEQLAVIPRALPLAPENSEFVEEIRQMIVGRYRLLFTIRGTTVYVLHVRGPYVQKHNRQSEE